MTALTVLLLAVTGCQSPQAIQPPSPTSNSRSPVAQPQSPSPTPSATAKLPLNVTVGQGYLPFGHFLAELSGSRADFPQLTGPAKLYVIGHGWVTIAAKTLLPNKELSSDEVYTSIGTAEQPRFAGLVEYRRPAAGLEEQKYVTLLLAIDPITMTVLKETVVLEADTESRATGNLTGSSGSAVALSLQRPAPAGSPFSSIVTTYGYDALTGAKTWEREGIDTARVFGAVVVTGDGSGMVSGSSDPCQRATGVDILTGRTLFELDYIDIDPECQNINIGASPGSASFITGIAEKHRYVRIKGGDQERTFNALTGAPVTLPYKLMAADPLTPLVAGEPVGNISETFPIIVTDSTDGSVKWTLPAEKVGKLNARVDGLFDGKLYLTTTDQKPVVDLATGTTIAENATRRPLGMVDGWTYWSDGQLTRES